MIELILSIALSFGLPPYFVVSIALVENPALDPAAVHYNVNGTVDRGVMQLNSSWYAGSLESPAVVREACALIRALRRQGLNWWQTAIAYNCGLTRFNAAGGPPPASIDYANRVFEVWGRFENIALYAGH